MEWVRGDTIGRGSFSVVSLATPKHNFSCFPPLMAVKSCEACNSKFLDNEREILSQLGTSCPQIIRCFGSDKSLENHELFHHLLLEYASGGSLSHLLKKSGGCFLQSDVKRYAKSILLGLKFIHDKGFVHCDLKLDNLLVFDDGEVKISDFGLAKKAGQKQGQEQIRGTPLYMAPESINDNEYESGCDIWALGCSIVEMLTGKPAWNVNPRENFLSLLLKIGGHEGDESPIIPEELSCEGKDFLSKCFVRNPKERWTASMLLKHPFVMNYDDTVSLKDSVKEKEESSISPRGPLDLFDSISIQSSKDLRSHSSISCDSIAGADRIRRLAGDEHCNWSDSESWISVR